MIVLELIVPIGHTSAADVDPFREDIRSQILAVDDHVDRHRIGSESEAVELLPQPQRDRIAKQRTIIVIRHQCPLLTGTHAAQVGLLVEPDLVWLLIETPGVIAATGDLYQQIIGSSARSIGGSRGRCRGSNGHSRFPIAVLARDRIGFVRVDVNRRQSGRRVHHPMGRRM